jgi:hypothetical protein
VQLDQIQAKSLELYEKSQGEGVFEESLNAALEKKRKKGTFSEVPVLQSGLSLNSFPQKVSTSC